MKYLSVFCIGLISVYDIYLTMIFSEYISIMERNAFANMLISNYGVENFIFAKSLLTLIVCVICCVLLNTKYSISVYFVMLFQIGLFMYLTFSAPDGNKSVEEKITPIGEVIKLIN